MCWASAPSHLKVQVTKMLTIKSRKPWMQQTMKMILTKIVATILCFGIVSGERITSFGVEWTHLEQQGANNRSGDQIWSSERWPDIFANSPYHTSCSREWRWLIVCTIVHESYIVCRTKIPMYINIAGFCDYKNEFPHTYRFPRFSRVPRRHIISLFLFFWWKSLFLCQQKCIYFQKRVYFRYFRKNVFLFIGDCIFVPAEMYFFPDRVYFPSSKNLFLVLRERRPAGDKLLVHRQRQRPHLASILEHPSEHQEHKFSTYFESSAYWLYIWSFKKTYQPPLTFMSFWLSGKYQISSVWPWFTGEQIIQLLIVIKPPPPHHGPLEVMALWTGVCLLWRQSYFIALRVQPNQLRNSME